MREKLRTSTREKVLFGLLAVVVAGSFMPQALAAIANVGSHWVSGELVFYDESTKATIFTIKDSTDGVVVATTLDATTLSVGGTAITATAAELNYLDVTAGAATASKAVVLDANADIDAFQVVGTMTAGTIGCTGTATLSTVNIDAGAIDGTAIGDASPHRGAFTTGTLSGLTLAGDEYIGRFTYSADPNDTTATLTATNVLIGDFVIGGAQSGSANGTYKNLQGATPQNGSILLTFEVDPGAAVTYSFLVFR